MTISAQDAKMIGDAVAASMRAQGFAGSVGKSPALNTYKGNSDDPEFTKLTNLMKNNGAAAKQFNTMMKNIVERGTKLENVFSLLEKTSRDQTDIARKSTLALGDYLKELKNAAKGTQAQSAALVEGLKNASSAAEKAKNIVNTIGYQTKKLDTLVERKIKLESDRAAAILKYSTEMKLAQEELAKAKKSKKKGATIAPNAKIKDLNENHADDLDAYKEALAESNEEVTKFGKVVSESISDLESFNKITNILSKTELDRYKNIRSMSKDDRDKLITETKDKVIEGSDALGDATKTAAGQIGHNVEAMGSNLEKAGDMALKFGKALLGMIPGLVDDMMVRQKSNVDSTNYMGDIGRGVSDQERSALIDQNRVGFRALGGGNEERGFDQGSKAVQEAAHLFGVTGAAAIEKAMANQQTTMSMGISASNSPAQQQQMGFMHQLSKQVGVTDDQLQEFYTSLSDSGQMLALNQKYANKSEADRQKAINAQIQQTMTLNRTMGVTIDQMKEQQQATVSQRYAGVEDLIRGQIGAKAQVANYNKNNPNNQISAADSNFLATSRATVGANGTLDDPDAQKKYLALQQRIAVDDMNQKKSAQDIAQKTGNMSAMYGQAVVGQVIGQTAGSTLGGSQQDFDTKFAGQKNRADTQGKDAVGKESFDQNWAKAVEDMNGPTGLRGSIIDLKEAFEGFEKSFGGGGEGFLSGAGKFVAGQVGYQALKYGATAAIGSGIGTTVASGVGAAASTVGGVATTGIGAMAASGIAGIATIAVAVLGSAAVGAVIGSWISDHLVEGTKIGDMIGSAMAHTMALAGHGDAQTAITDNKKNDAIMASNKTRYDALNSTNDAELAAVKAKGTSGYAAALQTAESARADYKKTYGVDLTGGAVGYDKIAPSSDTATSPAAPLSPSAQIAAATTAAATAADATPLTQAQMDAKKLAEDQLKAQQAIAANTKVVAEKTAADKLKEFEDAKGSIYKDAAKHFQETVNGLRN